MSRTSDHSLAILATCLIGASISNLNAATFSDDNWTSMGGISGVDGEVDSVAVDGSGNIYVGGAFTIAGDVFATNIAKWDGRTWSALGPGVGGVVWDLAVSGSDLFVGGLFNTAGGMLATNIAQWNGTNWSALGSGVGGTVTTMAVSGGDLYAGGLFTTA